MFKISVYGKGGVGKSTVSSNLSYLISKKGLKVFHIGCDPKHDSTRLLTNGVSQKTFMDSLLDGSEEGVIEKGSNDISCMECGGAEPGIGCAGKGMITMFNFAEKNTPEDTDVRVCDVLGDVVCGGFSVPMRRKQTDGILLVVSEDFMSVYAANNILRGIRNLNGSECIMGIVLNSRTPEDRIRVEQFSVATGIPILGTIDKSNEFSDAEGAGKTVSELYPEGNSCRQMQAVADRIIEIMDTRKGLVRARPLNENAMTQIAAKQVVTDFEPPKVRLKCRFDTVDRERGLTYRGDQAMPACTSHGAVEVLLSMKDAAVVLHGPRNCAFLMEAMWARRSYMMRSGRGYSLPDNLYSTQMDSSNIFTGDRTILHDTIQKCIDDGYRTIFVVLSCTPDIIGTDVDSVIRDFDGSGAKIISVEPDDYFLGGKFGGFKGGVTAMSKLVDWSLPVVPGRTAILSFEPNFTQKKVNVDAISEILHAFGLSLGPIVMDCQSVDDIRTFSTCQYFIRLGIGFFGKCIAEAMVPEDRGVIQIDPPSLMVGIKDWCGKLSAATGDLEAAERFVAAKYEYIDSKIGNLKGKYSGRKTVFYVPPDTYIDPYIDILDYLGFETVARLYGVPRFDNRDVHSTAYDIPSIQGIELCHLPGKADEYNASLIVSGDPRIGRLGRTNVGLAGNYLGADGFIEWARRVDNSMFVEKQQKWKEGSN